MFRLGLVAGLLLVAVFAGCVEKVERGLGESGASADPDGSSSSGGQEGAGEPAPGSGDGGSGGGSGGSSGGDPSTAPPTVPNRTISWAPPGEAAIRPGVVMTSEGGQCTSNFVFTDPNLTQVYLGFAAHCVASGEATETNGCDAAVGPFELGDEVEVEGAAHPATLAYTSWGTMQAVDETDEAACADNDFAVVALDPQDWDKVSPAMLHFGGPNGLATSDDARPRAKVLSYGHSGLRLGTETLNPREGYIVGNYDGGWSHGALFVTSGVPGDSGSGVLTGDGRALGVLVTLGLGTNGITNLDKALEYARTHGGPDLVLAEWDQLESGLLPPL